MIAAALGLSLALLGPAEGPAALPTEDPARPPPSLHVPAQPAPTLALRGDPQRRARRAFITSYVLMGVTLVSETSGAIVSTRCQPGEPCDLDLSFDWGSARAGTRLELLGSGTGSAYVIGRGVGVAAVSIAKVQMALAGQAQGIVDARAGRAPADRRLAVALLASGLSLWALSRLARLGFVIGGVCQQPACLYTFDQLSLGTSRGLNFAGSALLLHHNTHRRVRLSAAPVGVWGLGVSGRF